MWPVWQHLHIFTRSEESQEKRARGEARGVGFQLMGSINRAAAGRLPRLDLLNCGTHTFWAAHPTQQPCFVEGVLIYLKHSAPLVMGTIFSRQKKTSLVLLNENYWSLQTNKQGHKNRCLPEPKDTWSCEQTGDDVTNTAGPIETKRPS